MELKKGDTFHIGTDVHMIDAVIGDDVYVERLRDNSLKKYAYAEILQLVNDSKKKGWYEGPWPIVRKHYLHDEKYGIDEELMELGLSEQDRQLFRYVVHELELTVELHKNGDVYITHIKGIELPEKIKTD